MKRVASGTAILLLCFVVAAPILHSHSTRRPRSQGNAANSQVTFNRDIAPIVFRYCAGCHRPGESGPFPLLTYKDAKSHARQIAAVTQTKLMPPWLPEPGEFKFADELRLSDVQIALFAKWAEQGATEGTPSDLPAKPAFVKDWQIGKPDLIIKAEKPYLLPASGSDQ